RVPRADAIETVVPRPDRHPRGATNLRPISPEDLSGIHPMHLKELKTKAPAQLVEMAEELGVEGASTLRKQDLMFSILKELAEEGEEIIGSGTIEVLPDSFGFLRSSDATYLAGPDDIYVSPNQVRNSGLHTLALHDALPISPRLTPSSRAA